MMIRIKPLFLKTALAFCSLMIFSSDAAFAKEISLTLPDKANSNIEIKVQNDLTRSNPADFLQVFVGPKSACCDGKSPMAGRYTFAESTLIFDPAFDFVTGQRYTVLTRNRTGDNTVVTELNEFTLRQTSETIKPEVLMVYPSAASLPENTLRFYIHFSTPMKPHLAAKFIKLVDAQGNADTTAFMKFKQELWSQDRRRLTLLMDPGRIKRGVAQNLTQGPALLEGNTYSIVIDEGWTSASGTRQLVGFKKTFSVTSSLRTLPNTGLWQVESPNLGTRNPLIINFDRPFDHQLAQSSITVLNEDGNLVPGTVSVSGYEKIWRFHPESNWKGDSLQVVVDTQFEDVAGNNFKDLLDHSVNTDIKSINEIRFEVELNKTVD